MKKQPFKLLINEPCSEDWNKMTPSGAGKFCNACSKVVVDFTSMTEAEIIRFLQSSKGETCGRVRMRESQLNHQYNFAMPGSNPFRNIAFRYTVAGLLTFASLKSAAQSGPASIVVTNYVQVKDNSGKVLKQGVNAGKEKHTISVRINNKFTGKSLSNAYVLIAGVNQFFRCEKGADFIHVQVPDSMIGKTIELYIHSSGYETEVRSVTFGKGEYHKDLNINMDRAESIKMGKMIYVPDEDTAKKCNK